MFLTHGLKRGWQVDRGNLSLQSSVIHTICRIICKDQLCMRFLLKLCILNCWSLERGPYLCYHFFSGEPEDMSLGQLKALPAHLELFNRQHCARGHQYSSTLTEPTRCLPHWQDNVLLSIAVSVKVFYTEHPGCVLGSCIVKSSG